MSMSHLYGEVVRYRRGERGAHRVRGRRERRRPRLRPVQPQGRVQSEVGRRGQRAGDRESERAEPRPRSETELSEMRKIENRLGLSAMSNLNLNFLRPLGPRMSQRPVPPRPPPPPHPAPILSADVCMSPSSPAATVRQGPSAPVSATRASRRSRRSPVAFTLLLTEMGPLRQVRYLDPRAARSAVGLAALAASFGLLLPESSLQPTAVPSRLARHDHAGDVDTTNRARHASRLSAHAYGGVCTRSAACGCALEHPGRQPGQPRRAAP